MAEEIKISVRDINGERRVIRFANDYEAYKWARNCFEEDEEEILVITQGTICLYSMLMSDRTLTAEDLTGFFC